jgi:hypothetical protein
MKMLYNKWWKGGAKVCPRTDYKPSKASPLNVVNIGGIFVVLLCGLSFAILVAIAEFCMKVDCENELHPATVNIIVRGGGVKFLAAIAALYIVGRSVCLSVRVQQVLKLGRMIVWNEYNSIE